MHDGYREYTYSTTNNWPTYAHSAAHGVSLPYLLREAGLLDSATAIKLVASDGYYFILTIGQVVGTRYSYRNHGSSGSSGATVVEPIIAWEWGDDGNVREESLRSFIGQCGPNEVNTSAFVRNLISIEVLASPIGSWDAPAVSTDDGSSVPFGTELFLSHEDMDNVKIYYTLDGSEPDYNSRVYNRSTSYYQPYLTVPIVILRDTTIRAFAAGLGRNPSPIVTFTYSIVEE